MLYLLLFVIYFVQWYARFKLLLYLFPTQLMNISLEILKLCLFIIVMSGNCNMVDPLRLDLAKWKTILKQFDSFSVSDHLVEPRCKMFKCECKMRVHIFFYFCFIHV